MKTKKLVNVVSVLALAMAFASCGKDNKTNTNAVSTNGFGNFPVGANGQTVSSQYCQGGQATSYSFSFVGQNTSGAVQFNYSSISAAGGQVVQGGTSNVYYGRDVSTGDQIAVQKITNGYQAQYNVQLSICPMQTYMGPQPIQVQQIYGGWLQVGGHTGSGVNSTITFQASVGGQVGMLDSIFSPAQ